MVNLNELRAGNYIYEIVDTPKDPEAKELFKVAAVNTLTGTLINEYDDITQAEYCEPIPLTPEILERCGFAKGEDSNTIGEGATYYNGNIIIVEVNKGYELFASEWTIGETFFYLHELQNICLDLFKFELEIKELQITI